ncbi:enhancer of filamentation 1-like [Clavelina lepadiformis]|uniref:enhancer of filamentation 1-like n=1 Tax=Clavelina lepadiformis TaxID=159417 RepID=UPI004041C8F0
MSALSVNVVLARAVYENVSESQEELAFKRGDVVTVIEQNTSGLEGWWLCSFQGRQGIAPGNRLQILPGMHGSRQSTSGEDTYDVPPTHIWNRPVLEDAYDEEYDVPRRQPQTNYNNNNMLNLDSPTEIYDIPRSTSRRPVHGDDDDEVYDIPTAAVPVRGLDAEQEVYNIPSNFSAIPDPMAVYDVPPLVSRGPQSHPEEVYDVPPRRIDQPLGSDMILVQDPEELYDVPPTRIEDRTLKYRHESTGSDVVYDIPQSNKMKSGRVISSGLHSLRRMRREITENNRSQPPATIEEPTSPEYVYDVPPQVSRDNAQSSAVVTNPDEVVDGLLKRLSITNAPNDPNLKKTNRMSSSSINSYSSYIDNNPSQYKELKLSVEDAIEQLISLKQLLEDAVSSLLTLVKENWRTKQNMSGKVHDVQKSFLEVLVAVNKFLTFARGATANACSGSEDCCAPMQVQAGLRKFLVPLEEDLEMLKRALNDLDASQWDINKLAIDNNSADDIILDEVDSFVMTSRAVSDDATQMAIFIHTHAQYIFKKLSDNTSEGSQKSRTPSSEKDTRPVQEILALQARPLPAIPSTRASMVQPNKAVVTDPAALMEDYDYVALQDKEDTDQNSGNLISGLNKRKTQLFALGREIKQSKHEVFKINQAEKHELKKQKIDVPEMMQTLSEAIDRFINAVDSGQPPHTFVALSKQVILCAHKLVFVGDFVHQHISNTAAKTAIKDNCELMCACLKKAVVSAKLAALQWPSVPAVQDTVDKMFEIATSAHQTKLTLTSILS